MGNDATPAGLAGPLRTLWDAGAVGLRTDAELLDRFVSDRDEAAFAALVDRHGPMVLQACRAVLEDAHEAQDAWQATFLVFARRAGTIRRSESVGPWLFGVGRRVSLRARGDTLRRRALLKKLETLAANEHRHDEPPRSWAELHEEIDRLPACERSAIVLCDLEGLTHDAAAHNLNWPVRTVRKRLYRGRDRLRGRLERRGVTLASASLGPLALRGAAPTRLAVDLIRGGTAPANVLSLAEGVSRAMMIPSWKTIAATLAACGVIGAGSVWALGGQDAPKEAPAAKTQRAVAEPKATQGRDDPDPAKAAPDELAGVVVDAQGKPIAGADVGAYYWVPDHPKATTDARGRFLLKSKHFDPGGKPEIRIRREGYETKFPSDAVVGEPGWVVVLGNTTYFEGRVLAPDGSPVADALIRADSGPRRTANGISGEHYTETKSGNNGRYRLYVEPASYDVQVRVPGVGVARMPAEAIVADQVREFDIKLAPGARFVARTVDRETGKPVPGVKLWHWAKPGVEGTADARGTIAIEDLPPGTYPRFEVEAKGYARWWSDACLNEWNRLKKQEGGFQRNFDWLDFEISPGMDAVEILFERGVTIRGRVFDPDGKPVAGATVAPAKTGSGNSLTGDTRFSVETDKDGRYEAIMPASGDVEYNLVAHDGKYQEWRTWANGVLPPMKTTPGQVLGDVDLRLTRPGTVTGRVVNIQGEPVAGREVRASPADKRENRYYDPTTKTGPDGTFTLKFVRPGEHHIQVAPFWLSAEQAPPGTSQLVEVEAGKVRADVELTVAPEQPNVQIFVRPPGDIKN